MSDHYRYHYSITIETADEVVLQCLRSISDYSQVSGNKRIVWGGTKKKEWQRDGYQVTFHFSDQQYRNVFKIEAQRVLPKGLWHVVKEKDNDPAIPQK
jgi:hypothetical protein